MLLYTYACFPTKFLVFFWFSLNINYICYVQVPPLFTQNALADQNQSSVRDDEVSSWASRTLASVCAVSSPVRAVSHTSHSDAREARREDRIQSAWETLLRTLRGCRLVDVSPACVSSTGPRGLRAEMQQLSRGLPPLLIRITLAFAAIGGFAARRGGLNALLCFAPLQEKASVTSSVPREEKCV